MVVDTLSSLPSEAYILLSTVLGGAITLTGTYLFNWNQRRIETNHLRTALATEIKSSDINRIRELAADLNNIEIDESEVISPEDREELSDEQLKLRIEGSHRGRVIGRFNRYNEKYPKRDVYEQNLGKIGTLNEIEITAVIQYYDQLDLVSTYIERVIEASSVGSTDETQPSYQDELNTLHGEVRLLLLNKELALKALGELDEEYREQLDEVPKRREFDPDLEVETQTN